MSGRVKRQDALPSKVCTMVSKFWQDNTRVSPIAKEVVRKRVAAKHWITHPAHHLMESQLSLYTRFTEEHPSVILGLRSFEALKPWYVKRLKEFNSCCCRYHVQMAELKDALNSMRRGALHRCCSCSCDVCKTLKEHQCLALNSAIEGVRAMCDRVLCPHPEDSEFHSLECIRGDCPDCGVSTLNFCSNELDHDSPFLLIWRRFENVVVGQNEEGGDRRAL